MYPDLMNIYGDDGNIICLVKRCQWRGIEAEVDHITIGDKINPKKYDLYFFGGGQDQQQTAVSADLKKTNGKLLKVAAKEKAVIFTVCGGYQLLGHYYKPHTGAKLPGIGLLDIYTIANKKRMIGNIVIETNSELRLKESTIVGFENHSGQTFLGHNVKPLGKVLKGHGNNGKDKTEGAFSDRVFGCYLHGSCLPKNPNFADLLIEKALMRRYKKVKLEKLDEGIENLAHESAVRRAFEAK